MYDESYFLLSSFTISFFCLLLFIVVCIVGRRGIFLFIMKIVLKIAKTIYHSTPVKDPINYYYNSLHTINNILIINKKKKKEKMAKQERMGIMIVRSNK